MMTEKMQNNEAQVNEMVKRTYRYYYDDGLAELAIGLLFMLLGLVLFGWLFLGTAPWVTITVVAVTVLLILAAPFLAKWVVQNVKERVTYQRTGYVAYRPGEPNAGRWIVIGGVLIMVLLMLVLPEWFSQMSLVVGAILALVLGLLGYRAQVWRFYLVAAVALGTGILTAIWGAEEVIGSALTFGITGLVLVLTGGITLLAYLRQHPRPEGVENE